MKRLAVKTQFFLLFFSVSFFVSAKLSTHDPAERDHQQLNLLKKKCVEVPISKRREGSWRETNMLGVPTVMVQHKAPDGRYYSFRCVFK